MLATSAIAALWQPITMTYFARPLSGQVTCGSAETVLL
jgi:hypothetical protein